MKEEKKAEDVEANEVPVHNICGHFSEKDAIWNVLILEPGHPIIIEAIDNNEYTLTEDKKDVYADVIRSKTYFWRPLSNYDGLNPAIPNRNKTKDKVSRDLAVEKMEKKQRSKK